MTGETTTGADAKGGARSAATDQTPNHKPPVQRRTMTEDNVTGDTRRELRKYRITFALAVAGLALAGWMFQTAYQQHVDVLNIGDKAGEQLQMRGMTRNDQGASHDR